MAAGLFTESVNEEVKQRERERDCIWNLSFSHIQEELKILLNSYLGIKWLIYLMVGDASKICSVVLLYMFLKCSD